MNIMGKSVSWTIAAVGMQLLLAAQVLALPTLLVVNASDGMQVTKATTPINNPTVLDSGVQEDSKVQERGDSPDMGGREGVPPSAGSGSR
jgi:hypothetical protein